MYIAKVQSNLQKMFLLFLIIAFEPVAGKSLIYDENTCGCQTSCYQTLLRLWIGLREMLSSSNSPTFMENWDKSAAVYASAVLGTHENVDSGRVF